MQADCRDSAGPTVCSARFEAGPVLRFCQAIDVIPQTLQASYLTIRQAAVTLSTQHFAQQMKLSRLRNLESSALEAAKLPRNKRILGANRARPVTLSLIGVAIDSCNERWRRGLAHR